MKPITLFALVCLTVPQALFAQTPVYTTPTGYTTKDLTVGINLVGMTVLNSPVASGQFETINQTTLVDTQLSYTPVAGRTYVLEFATGSMTGAIFEVSAANITGTTITISTVPATNLTSLGLTTSDRYNLRLAPTLEEIFTTTSLASGGVLQAGFSSLSADVVWVPTGPGTYSQYYLNNSGAFTAAGGTTPAPNVPVIYADGLFVQKKGATAAKLTLTGEVKTVGTTTAIGQGFNLITVVVAAGATLANAGFEDDIQGGFSSLSADVVWIQQANLSYKQYFRNNTNTAWRDAANGTTDLTTLQAQAVVISGAVLIQRKGATPISLDLNVPY
ncbi:MAG: hypothetical protein V4727_07830 [Verrucomicrobiota bacterium]